MRRKNNLRYWRKLIKHNQELFLTIKQSPFLKEKFTDSRRFRKISKLSYIRRLLTHPELTVKVFKYPNVIMSYPKLLRKGKCMASVHDPKKFWAHRQKCYYKIVPIHNMPIYKINGKRTLPPKTKKISYESFRHIASVYNILIEHDLYKKRVRLWGNRVLADPRLRKDAGVGPWVNYYD